MVVFFMLDDSSLECFRLTKLSTRWIKILLFLGFELLKLCIRPIQLWKKFRVVIVDVDKRVSSLTNKKISCISLCMDVRIHLCVRLI